MLITIISAEHSLRSKWVREYFASKGDEVKIISVNTSSVHSFFAKINFLKQLRKSLDALSPNLIYCDATIDFLMRELTVYKNKNNNVKLVFDVCDDIYVDQKYLNQGDYIFCASESCRYEFLCFLFKRMLYIEAVYSTYFGGLETQRKFYTKCFKCWCKCHRS